MSNVDNLNNDHDEENVSSYLDDDSLVLKGEDSVVYESNDTSIFKQDEGVISWELINFYKENGYPRGKMSLKNEPPVLRISSNDGSSVDFLLTQDFTRTLGSAINNVNKGFHGVVPKSSKKTFKEKISDIKSWVRLNKVKSLLLGVIAVSMVLTVIL